MTFASSDNYMINIAKSWLFRNKWCIFAQKHLQAKIHHVAVICSDYEQSKYFYTEVLDRQAVCVLLRPRRTADRTVRKVKNHHL